MKHRILGAALAVTAAMGATLTMTGTASAQLPITRATVTVDCSTPNRATLRVDVTNGARTSAEAQVRTPLGTARETVAAGATEAVEFRTNRSRIEGGTVEVTVQAGNSRTRISQTYQGKDCAAPQIRAVGTDSDRDGRVDSVTVTNNGPGAARIEVQTLTQRVSASAPLARGASTTLTLDDRSPFAIVQATWTVGGRTQTATETVTP